jgi:hypothetical protein
MSDVAAVPSSSTSSISNSRRDLGEIVSRIASADKPNAVLAMSVGGSHAFKRRIEVLFVVPCLVVVPSNLFTFGL